MSVIESDPEVMSGVPCFAGTRVPVDSLFDHLAGNSTLADFLEQFPGVSRQQAEAVLEEAREQLVGPHWLRGRRSDIAPASQTLERVAG